MTSSKRPKYLNLLRIRLPLPGMVSIAHRISGVLMFVAIPVLAYLLDISAGSETGYQQVQIWFAHPLLKLALVIIGWSICHHLYAGIRYLLLDADIGIDLPAARLSAKVVMAAAIVSTLVILWVVV
ncbi:MAG: succinate dehydrogenase, cytochrome b556 subunit [Gammaproteobacteria bacterium]|nr:succinate dehydrogenase, cytochrome b556 subunit [Gammaproteobacteria bacterium]